MDKKIQNQLIKPFVEKMEKEWQDLYDKVCQSEAHEALELKPVVEGQLGKIRELIQNPAISGDEGETEAVKDMHDFVRQSKMDFRNAQRRWQRHIVSTERIRTRQSNSQARFSPPPSE